MTSFCLSRAEPVPGGPELRSWLIYSSVPVLADASSKVYRLAHTNEDCNVSFVFKEQSRLERSYEVGNEVAATCQLEAFGDDESTTPGLIRPILTCQAADTAYFVYRDAGVDLQTLCERWTMEQRRAHIRLIAACLFAALKRLHDVGFVNRDVKLENLAWDNEKQIASILDLGCAVKFHDRSFAHTPGWAAPELFRMEGGMCGCDQEHIMSQLNTGALDVFALGLALLWLGAGVVPRELSDGLDRAAIASFSRGSLEQFLECLDVDPSFKDLLRVTLEPEPSARWTSEQVLQHPYVQDMLPQVYERWACASSRVSQEVSVVRELGSQLLAQRLQGTVLPYVDARAISRDPQPAHSSASQPGSATACSSSDCEPETASTSGSLSQPWPHTPTEQLHSTACSAGSADAAAAAEASSTSHTPACNSQQQQQWPPAQSLLQQAAAKVQQHQQQQQQTATPAAAPPPRCQLAAVGAADHVVRFQKLQEGLQQQLHTQQHTSAALQAAAAADAFSPVCVQKDA